MEPDDGRPPSGQSTRTACYVEQSRGRLAGYQCYNTGKIIPNIALFLTDILTQGLVVKLRNMMFG